MGLMERAAVESRATLEDPSTSLANPDVWMVNALGGGQTAAGKNVNHKNALKLSAVWGCTKVISEDVGKLPLPVYERLERGKERARGHALYRVLHDEFNPQMSAFNGRRTLQAHVLNWGNAFAEIERNNSGDVIALWPLLPDRTKAERIDGRKVIVTRVNGEDVPLDAENVLHIPGLGFDGLRGYSVIGHAKQAIGAAMAAEEFGAGWFGNGAIPGGIIKRHDSLSEEAQSRVRRSWNKVHQGLSGAQRVAILDEGMEYEKIGIPPEDSQFISTRQFGVEDIIRFYRVPPHKVQHLLHAGVRANVESENISYVTDTLQSWLVGWEQEINRTLFDDEERDTFFAEHVIEGLLRGDSQARGNFYQQAINNGWMTPNEVREAENRNPMEGGDRLFVPLNLLPLDSPVVDEPDMDVGEPDEGEENLAGRIKEARARRSVTERHRLQRTHVPAFERVAQALIDEEAGEIEELVGEWFASRSVPGFLADVDRFYRDFEDTVEERFAPLVTSYAEMVRGIVSDEMGVATEPAPQYERFVEDYTEGMAARHVRKSRAQLRAVVDEADEMEMEEAVGEGLERWRSERPGKVAFSETVRAGGAFARRAYALLGALTLRWVAIGESCPYCSRLNGKVVGIRENFANKGESIEPEGDDEAQPMRVKAHVGHPPAHGECDCLVGAGAL